MNCCDDHGRCRCDLGSATTTKPRSCDELGVCQERFPTCGGCMSQHNTDRMTAGFATGPSPRYDFAPGVVQGYRVGFLGTLQQRRELRRFACSALWWMTWCGLAAFAVGLISGYFFLGATP